MLAPCSLMHPFQADSALLFYTRYTTPILPSPIHHFLFHYHPIILWVFLWPIFSLSSLLFFFFFFRFFFLVTPLYPRKCTHPHTPERQIIRNENKVATNPQITKKQHLLNNKNANLSQYVKLIKSVFIHEGQDGGPYAIERLGRPKAHRKSPWWCGCSQLEGAKWAYKY